MATLNYTGTSHSFFILLGIPGLEDQHTWISLPFFISYLIAVLGNSLLVFIIITERSLHEPMYLFLCMLAVADLILSTTTVPKALAIFWFHAGEISLDGCVTQIFFIHATFIAESGILLAMAFDRYVAICNPLRYTAVLSRAVIIRVALAVVMRSFSVILPDVFLVKRLPFCHRARQKALGTCGSHLGVISMFYLPGIFTIITQRFGHHVPLHTHILLANICMLAPPMLNPIIYGVKTKQIREHVVSTFHSGTMLSLCD
ncbi:unnamed protein product [Gulo gulo]|uniref:G-protein coupled receptors family 1 profile domain-containing protein n=1 Tax=Gulo gulo TaxID=48420 RepID=A0A9X9PWN3_GULGU|nr:unnamed protein product [Gulo gulo]